MTNAKLTRRALLSSVLALVLCFTMLLGATFAWFTDEAVSSGNKIVAGNLDVQLLLGDGKGNYTEITDASTPIFGGGNPLTATANPDNANTVWEPGKTQVAYLAIKNNGNLALKYQVSLKVENPENGKDLYKVMQYAITPDAKDGVAEWDSAKGKDVAVGAQIVSDEGKLIENGETHYFALSIHMDEDAGNGYKGGQVIFDITVLATQLNSESDSFGDQYDAEAPYPEVFNVATGAEIKSAVVEAKAGDTIVLTQDATIEGYAATAKLVIEKAITLDLNGNTLTTECGWGGIDAKGGCTIKNGTINHVGNTAAIKAFQVESIENVTINVTQTEGKTKGGIVVQEGSGCYVGSIKNVTITGATNGIETYRCGSRTDLAIGSMENVTIDATNTGILLSAPIGTVKNCNIEGDAIGINMYLYGPYSVSIDLVNSTVSGATGIYAHDEVGKTNPGSLTLTYDAETVITNGITQEFEAEVLDRVTVKAN